MSADVEFMFSVRENAWHDPEGKFTLPDYPADWDEARRLAGLEWEPELAPVFTEAQRPLGDPPEDCTDEERLEHLFLQNYPPRVELPDHRLVRRSDTGAPLGVVGKGWTPVPNRVLGEFIEATLELPNTRIATAGSLSEGRQVWALVELDEPLVFPGDDSPTLPYLAVLNGHDGSAAFRALPTHIRVVCRNTYRAAEMAGKRTGRQWTFRHTGSVMDRIEEAKRAIRGVKDDASAAVACAAELLALPASEKAYLDFVALFLPDPAESGEQVSQRVRDNVAAARSSFRTIYEASPTCDAHRGTALGLVDAGFEYLDHLRGYRHRDTYLGRTLLKPEPLKARAATLAREVCTV